MVITLSGGVGGAKFVAGLASILLPHELTIVVNTGDDFTYWGLSISPDLDSVMYRLAGRHDSDRGWGQAGETWHTYSAAKRLGAESWFQLGDNDLALHLRRSQLLNEGKSLSEVTQELCKQFNLNHHLVPMSDDSIKTYLDTNVNKMSFQDYFVKHQCQPVVKKNRIRWR